jgi:hypothetical protein
MLVVLLPSRVEPSLTPEVIDKLAELGVTSLAVTRDDGEHALVLEGWAFDPDRSGAAASSLVAGDTAEGRWFSPLMHLSIARSDHEAATSSAEASGDAYPLIAAQQDAGIPG